MGPFFPLHLRAHREPRRLFLRCCLNDQNTAWSLLVSLHRVSPFHTPWASPLKGWAWSQLCPIPSEMLLLCLCPSQHRMLQSSRGMHLAAFGAMAPQKAAGLVCSVAYCCRDRPQGASRVLLQPAQSAALQGNQYSPIDEYWWVPLSEELTRSCVWGFFLYFLALSAQTPGFCTAFFSGTYLRSKLVLFFSSFSPMKLQTLKKLCSPWK